MPYIKVFIIATSTFTIALENLPPDQRCMGANNCAEQNGKTINTGTELPLDRYLADSKNALLKWLADTNQTVPDNFFPLVLCGPTGVGKTRLAESVAGRVVKQLRRVKQLKRVNQLNNVKQSKNANQPINSPASTLMISAVEFRRRFVNAINLDSIEDFRQEFNRLTILVIDGVEQLKTSPQTQVELIHLLDLFSRSKKYLIMTSQSLPTSENDFQSQLASRMASGLVVPIERPGVDARLEIVHLLADKFGISIDNEGSQLFAKKMPVSVPRLYDSLLELESFAAGKKIDSKMVAACLAKMAIKTTISIEEISKQIARKFDIKLKDLCGKTRRQSVVDARAVAMYLTRDLLGLSYHKIGEYFGKRDHSTVRHSVQQVESKLLDNEYSSWLDQTKGKLTS